MKKKQFELIITLVVQLASTMFAALLSLWLLGRQHLLTRYFYAHLWVNAVLPLVVVSFLTYIILRSTQRLEAHHLLGYYYRSILSTLVMAGLWAVILLIAKNEVTDSRYFYVTVLVLYFAINGIFNYIVGNYVVKHFYNGSLASLVGVFTTSERAPAFLNELRKDWSRRIVCVALTDTILPAEVATAGSTAATMRTNVQPAAGVPASSVQPYYIEGFPVVAGDGSYMEWIRRNALDEVFLCLEDTTTPRVLNIIEELESMGIQVHINISSLEKLDAYFRSATQNTLFPPMRHAIDYMGKTPILTLEPSPLSLLATVEKRIFDLLGGFIGCIITAILFVFVGAAIKIESPGPVFFAQPRVGKNGRVFKMYKFRSMYKDAEQRKAELMEKNEINGLMFKITDDPRITKVGKFIRKTSIDEFPQFFNVLKGDMSLVGTRPPTMDEYNQYSSYHKRRLSMKPGITGMWQVSGRSDITDFEEVVQLDCQYIDNWSFKLDIKILLKTVLQIFSHKGAK